MFKEKTTERCIQIFDPELGGHFAESFLGKLQKQAIGKEGLEKRWNAGRDHSRTSRGISRSVAS